MHIGDIFEAAPKSERTLARHGYQVLGHKFLNDVGEPCFYRVVSPDGKELGAIRYYRGRLLVALELVKKD